MAASVRYVEASCQLETRPASQELTRATIRAVMWTHSRAYLRRLSEGLLFFFVTVNSDPEVNVVLS